MDTADATACHEYVQPGVPDEFYDFWWSAKQTRAEFLGKRCEICGEELNWRHEFSHEELPERFLVGHHVHGRDPKQAVAWHWFNCQLRCNHCEVAMHRNFLGNGGNSWYTRWLHARNNTVIWLQLETRRFKQTPQLTYQARN